MRRLAALTLVLVLCATPAWAAPTVDATASLFGTDGAVTYDHITTVGATGILVGCAMESASITLTGTYAGNSLAEVFKTQHSTQSNSAWLFFGASPTSGTNSVVITPSSETPDILCISATFTGSSTPTGGVGAETTAVDTAVSVDVTCAVGNLAVDFVGTQAGTSSFTAGASQTDILEVDSTNTAAMSSKAGAGTTAMSQDPNSVENLTYVAACLTADGGRRPISPMFMQ